MRDKCRLYKSFISIILVVNMIISLFDVSMVKNPINKIEISILRKNANNSLILVKENKFQKIIRLVKNILFRAKQYEISE